MNSCECSRISRDFPTIINYLIAIGKRTRKLKKVFSTSSYAFFSSTNETFILCSIWLFHQSIVSVYLARFAKPSAFENYQEVHAIIFAILGYESIFNSSSNRLPFFKWNFTRYSYFAGSGFCSKIKEMRIKLKIYAYGQLTAMAIDK